MTTIDEEWEAEDRAALEVARARAALGAAFLNVAYPEWRDVVNADELDMGSGRRCVWGQIAGGYMLTMRALFPQVVKPYPGDDGDEEHELMFVGESILAQGWMEERGFVSLDTRVDYSHLDAAWLEQLEGAV